MNREPGSRQGELFAALHLPAPRCNCKRLLREPFLAGLIYLQLQMFHVSAWWDPANGFDTGRCNPFAIGVNYLHILRLLFLDCPTYTLLMIFHSHLSYQNKILHRWFSSSNQIW